MPHTLSEEQCRGLVAICDYANASAVRLDGVDGKQATPKAQDMKVKTYSSPGGWDDSGYTLRPSGRWAPTDSVQFREPVDRL